MTCFDCKIEIIGSWIYCFDAYLFKNELEALGFWFSSRHGAWVYSGHEKIRHSTNKTLEQIRASKGSRKLNPR
jgi:hypothetical protein